MISSGNIRCILVSIKGRVGSICFIGDLSFDKTGCGGGFSNCDGPRINRFNSVMGVSVVGNLFGGRGSSFEIGIFIWRIVDSSRRFGLSCFSRSCHCVWTFDTFVRNVFSNSVRSGLRRSIMFSSCISRFAADIYAGADVRGSWGGFVGGVVVNGFSVGGRDSVDSSCFIMGVIVSVYTWFILREPLSRGKCGWGWSVRHLVR